MPSQVAIRDVPRFVNWSMITCAIGLGLGYGFGPPEQSASPTFDLLKTVLPIPMWGMFFLLAGVLMVISTLVGHALAVICWGTWGSVLFLYAIGHQMAGFGGVMWAGFFVAINGYEVYRWGQKAVLRFRHAEGGR